MAPVRPTPHPVYEAAASSEPGVSSTNQSPAKTPESSSTDIGDSGDADFVRVSREQYEYLLQISRQYTSLCDNLIRGGVNDETIALLSTVQQDDGSQASVSQSRASDRRESGFTSSRTSPSTHAFSGRLDSASGFRRPYYEGRNHWNTYDATSHDDDSDTRRSMHDPAEFAAESQHTEKRFPPRTANRTLLLSNLAERTTHADITNVIRGGQLIEIFIRHRERSASISFVYEEECKAFFEHVRRHDLYINQKRVEVSWNDRQFNLADHLARKIASGATRNLVIRRCGASHTKDSVRDDLEHIHNLVAISIEFIAGDCYVATNSVIGATFARTCMMSRLKYKSSRIEYDADECAQSIEHIPVVKKRNFAEPINHPSAFSMANRFLLLGIDED